MRDIRTQARRTGRRHSTWHSCLLRHGTTVEKGLIVDRGRSGFGVRLAVETAGLPVDVELVCPALNLKTQARIVWQVAGAAGLTTLRVPVSASPAWIR